MRLSLLFRSAAMSCAAWLGATGALAQSGYVTNGGEYAIAGSLPGDQTRPALSLNASGGYLVWQGNDVCRFGLGIAALALDNTCHGVGSHFRVNQIGVGDQENPQVSLLNGGGAAFVWQGGRQSFQHIYGRFLTASNTWAGGDLLISASTNCFQRNPAVATLNNGNVVVAYGSFNQANATSMQDVYAQILSPAGQKLGSEFVVNQFTDFNQRSPSVAALSNGGFVVVWVSELQRSGSPDGLNANALYSPTNLIHPTVDIYSRLFDANGTPLSGEFLVNTSSNLCARPRVAAAADGGFLITWAERDGQVPANGWDVYARAFGSDGTAGQPPSRINLYVQGDQHAPAVSCLGTNYLVVWTSGGQDGSLDGVYGRFLQHDGSALGDEFRVNTTTLGRQNQPTVASDGVGQFLTVWAGYSTVSHSQDLFAQVYGVPGFAPGTAVVQYAAPPAEGYIDVPPAGGTGALPPNTLAGFAMPLPPAASVSATGNAFAARPGNYNGLCYDTNGVNAVSAGSISVKVTTSYAYSAKLLLGGRSYSVSGQLDATGQDTKTIKRPNGLANLVVNLKVVHLSNANGDQVRGTVTAANQWQAQIVADRTVFDRVANKAMAYAGQYTVVVPPTTTGPAGSGYGTLTIDAGGNVRLAASLADGSKLTQSSTLSAQGYWPLYASLYKGQGLVTSWVQNSATNSSAHVIWIKPPGAQAPLFAGSFTNSVDAVISSYAKSTAVSLFQQGTVTFNGASLGEPLSKALTLDAHGKSLTPSASQLNLVLSPSTGLFRGTTSLLSPMGRKVTFQGVLVENGQYGAGFFQNNGASGQVYWSLQ